MLSQYYNFLNKKLLDFLDGTELSAGDRYFLILNDDKEINKMQEAILSTESRKVNEFSTPEFNFKTQYINSNNLKVIFVFATQGVTNDFLVTIRNKVSLQEGEWKDSVVVFMIKEDLDSITGGAFDLAKQGAPFHTKTLRNNLEKQLQKDKTSLSENEILVMNFVINKTFEDELVKYTLMDFESVYSIIEQGYIKDEDYYEVGLFKDKQIATYSKNEIKDRLTKNKELFDDVSYYHDRGNPKESLELNFDNSSVVNNLAKDDWYTVDFETVKKSKDAMDSLKKIHMEYLDEDFINQFKNMTVWDKAAGTTKAKKRERNIIIFKNHKNLEKISIPFSNNIKVDKNYIIKRGQKFFDLTEDKGIVPEIRSNKNKIILDISDFNLEDEFYFEFTYKHNNNNALTFKFRILLVNFESSLLEYLKTNYSLKYDNKSKKVEISVKDVENELKINAFNLEPIQVKENGQTFELEKNNSFRFSPLMEEDESNIYINLMINKITYKLKLSEISNKPVPTSGNAIVKNIYDKQASMTLAGNKIIQMNNEYYPYAQFKKMLNIENELVLNGYMYGNSIEEEFFGNRLNVPLNIEEAYFNLLNEIKKLDTLPSLMCLSGPLKEAAKGYCELIETELDNLPDNEKIIDERIKNILYIGTIKDEKNNIYLTPLHPLILRYEIQKSEKINGEVLSEKILKKYNPSGLLPYWTEGNSFFFSNIIDEYPRGIMYKLYSAKNKMNSERASSIIKSRLTNFKSHFKYLFNISPDFSLNTRFIDIDDYKMILTGVCEYILNEFNDQKHISLINPINIYIEDEIQSEIANDSEIFNEFYNLKDYKELVEMLGVKIPTKVKNNNEEEDVLEEIKEKINVFFNAKDQLYHVTFYNFNQPPTFSVNDYNKLNNSITDEGLLSNLTYTKMGTSYVSGFGIKDISLDNDLINSAKLWNSFVSNNQNNRLNPYNKNEVIANNVTSLESKNLKSIFDQSNWVTFIDPSVDLSYFNDNNYDLYVIHYNDHTSSFNYESITVTNNTKQYENVLKEFLNKVNVNFNSKNMENIIRSFNILNGEWLLSIIGSRSSRSLAVDNKVREKLSIIAAYKTVLSLLEESDICWIPISLEEIIRVSRQQGLDAKTDVFSTKELKHNGAISDDLLFIGLETKEDGSGVFHMLPVEVKVGINDKSVMSKAATQLSELYQVLNKHLIKDSSKPFTQNYYRHFFANLYFGNLKKFIENGVIKDPINIEILNRKTQVLNSHLEFSNAFNYSIAKGIGVFFTDLNSFRKIEGPKEGNILELHLNEKDAYVDAEKKYEELKDEILSGEKGISLSLFNKENIIKEVNEKYGTGSIDDFTGTNKKQFNGENENTDIPVISSEDQPLTEAIVNDTSKNSIEDTRILLGTVKGSTQKIFWEYGNYGLPNRHLLISGKSGQGKTYFMQCLLYEMSKNKIDSLVVDYTDGFLMPQLESDFKEKLNDNLITKFIYRDKLPLNPFKRNSIDLGGMLMDETNDDIADRVVQIIDFVFNLGIQQSSMLKEEINRGLEIYGENLTFSIIKQRLLDEESNQAQTLHGRISNLLNKDPFSYKDETFTWNNIFSGKGNVNIFQLKGYSSDIQKIITEFLLWDLYNFTEREGNKDHPIPVLLDEMQNLNHKESSPTTKILKEGRKFGWSSWLATQSINSIKNAGGDTAALYNAAMQIHFAPPEDQVANVSKTIATDKVSRLRVENQLNSLSKGECVVNGYTQINDELQRVTEVVDITPLDER